MRRRISRVLVCAVAMLGLGYTASAGTLVVNGFGVGGWTSWDTRNTSGTQLVGSSDTSPLWVGTHTTADDAAIGKQIVFMGEGQVVNDTAGMAPPASPTGSLNGLGYVRLDGTSSDSGKSDISYVQSNIAAASTLTSSGFSLSYRFFAQDNPKNREPGLNISITGTDSTTYTLSYTPGYTENAWNSESVSSTSKFTVYHSGVGTLNGGAAETLADWQADPNYGNLMFGTGAEIYRVGFNIGSGQLGGLAYLDSVQTSLLNGGGVIDFQQAPAPTPLPASAWGGLILLGGLGAWRLRCRSAAIS